MAKPLRLFIQPPYDSGSGPWTLIHSYGQQTSPPLTPIFHHYTLLRTPGTGELFAASRGFLSVRPPRGGALDPSEELSLPEPGNSLPEVVNLYLHLLPFTASEPLFAARASAVNDITAFAYLSVETESLESGLAEALDDATIPLGILPRAQAVELLIEGAINVPITEGHAIGKAATQGGGVGSRQVGFTAITGFGPVDPSHVYDLMRDFVADSQADLDAYLALAPIRWPLFDQSLSTNDAINLTKSNLYSMAVLQDLRTSRNLSLTLWRQVGNNQKHLFLSRLLSRTGHAPPGNTEPPFEFNDLDWKNPFQLEAVVEFYANFDDPWLPGPLFIDGQNKPRPRFLDDNVTPNPLYIVVDLLDLAGTAATVTGNVVTLDVNTDITRVRPSFDTILLERDTAHPIYRITAVNIDNGIPTVTVDGNPVFSAGSSAWKITTRPTIVVIDAFGNRDRLRGSNASVANPATPSVVTLNDPQDLRKVNIHFDTIYLASDTARPSRTYRIVARINAAHTVTVDGNPSLDSGGSVWYIPAGVGGELPLPNDDLGGNDITGFDHLDGVLFIVQFGEVQEKLRWGSYTARAQRVPGRLSSIRGNRRYDFQSFMSVRSDDESFTYQNCLGHVVVVPFREYSLSVTDSGAIYDGVREARFYFAGAVTDDTAPGALDPVDPGLGKTHIRLHHSRHIDRARGINSAGCIVSPSYDQMRTSLIRLYQRDHLLTNPNLDSQIEKLMGLDHDQSMCLWERADANQPAGLSGGNWNAKIIGTLWLIRPDERPLG